LEGVGENEWFGVEYEYEYEYECENESECENENEYENDGSARTTTRMSSPSALRHSPPHATASRR